MRWAAWTILALLGGCAAGPQPEWSGPRPVTEVDRWDVRAGGRYLGQMLLLQIEAPVPDEAVPFYQFQNAQGQWLGYVDVTGRVYQRVPFSMTEIFRGIHPMEKAIALLYEEPGPLTLATAGGAPVPVEAAARRDR